MNTPKVVVYVKHYLTPDGMVYFQQEWFPRVESILSEQPGFVFIHQHIEGPCAHLVLQFKDAPTFEQWLQHPLHDELVHALDVHRDRNWWEAVRTDEEHADPQQLEWTIIKLHQEPL